MQSSSTQTTRSGSGSNRYCWPCRLFTSSCCLGSRPASISRALSRTLRNDPTVILQQLINGSPTAPSSPSSRWVTRWSTASSSWSTSPTAMYTCSAQWPRCLSLSPFIFIDPNTGGESRHGGRPCSGLSRPWRWRVDQLRHRAHCLSTTAKLAKNRQPDLSAIGMSFILQNIGLQLASVGKLANHQGQVRFWVF